MFLILLIIIIICFYCFSIEYFNSDIDTSYTEIKDIIYPNSKVSCCLVKKSFQPNTNNIYGGDFIYSFEKKKDDDCDISLYNDNSSQLLIDNLNNWSNHMCTSESNILGSCRNINKECIDFVTKDFCDKYKMKWSNKTCQRPLEFTWIDPIKIKLSNKNSDLGTFKMF
jgi:hypothetical protein